MERIIVPNKIIRRQCIITLREINEPYGKLHIIHKIAAVIEDAHELAATLNYPAECLSYEIFDIDIPAVERSTPEKPINDIEEMLTRASAYGVSAKYTYVIDKEYDKNGKKFS